MVNIHKINTHHKFAVLFGIVSTTVFFMAGCHSAHSSNNDAVNQSGEIDPSLKGSPRDPAIRARGGPMVGPKGRTAAGSP